MDLFNGGEEYSVKSYIVHKNFDENTMENDIAILILSKSISFNGNVKKISLATKNYASGTPAIVTGWGALKENGSASDTLMKLHIPIINLEKCKENYEREDLLVTEEDVCAGDLKGGRDCNFLPILTLYDRIFSIFFLAKACQGDSGGPLIVAKNKLIGIVSFGEGCGRPGLPGVYTSVFYFSRWIEKTILEADVDESIDDYYYY